MKVSLENIPHRICCYSIKNTANGRFYIGFSKNGRARLENHLRQLRNRCHRVTEMQDDYNKYGEDAFEIHIYGSEWGILFDNMEFAFIRHACDNNAPIYNVLIPKEKYKVKNQLFGDYAKNREDCFNIYDYDYYKQDKKRNFV